MCKLMPWNLINLIHGKLAHCSLPLPMSFPQSDLHFYCPDTHFCESRLSIHHKLPYWQHSGQPHSEGESLPPSYAHRMLMCTKECSHPEESTMVSKQMLDNIHLLPFYFTVKKTQTQYWLCQSITHLPDWSRKHALSIDRTHWCTNVPKDANSMATLAKAMLWTTFFAFKGKSIAVRTQTQQQSFLFSPLNSSKSMHASAPSLLQIISMRKCFNQKRLLWGAHTLTWAQKKHSNLCASLITFSPICVDVQTDAMKPR